MINNGGYDGLETGVNQFEALRFTSSFYRPTFYERETGAGTVMVDMNDQGSLRATGGVHEAIATFGLGGCTAVAVVLESPDGAERIGIIAHYSPMAILAQQHKQLEALLRRHWTSGWKAAAYVVTPGQSGQPTKLDTGMYTLLPRDGHTTALFISILYAALPGLQKVSIHGYSMLPSDESKTEQGTVVIRFTPSGDVHVFVEGMPA